VALAAHGGGVTAEAADVVVLADDLGRVPEAVRIARRALGIAHQSIWIGLGLSAVAMGFAAAGAIAPAVGAVLQEGIDVAVILNALRAGRAPRSGSTSLVPTVSAATARARDTGSAGSRPDGSRIGVPSSSLLRSTTLGAAYGPTGIASGSSADTEE
jgi:hypothetical protein